MRQFTFFASKSTERQRGGGLFLVSVFLLWGLGLFTLFVCSPNTAMRLFNDKYYFVVRQLMWSLVGFIALFVVSIVPFRTIRKVLPVLVLVTLVLCLMTRIPGIGSSRNGAPRWLKIPFVGTIQPSEFAKFVVVLFLANLFDKYARNEESSQQNYFYPLAGLLIFVSVIFLQKDFSTGVFIFTVGTLMFFVSGENMKWFIPVMILGIAGSAIMICLDTYRLERLMAFFKPEDYALTIRYQQNRSCMAITAGGFWGNGMGSGMSYVNSIPEVQADYIFAGWAESMGYFGVLIYFALLALFAWRGLHCALTAKSRFASIAAFGFIVSIVAQSVMNVAVVGGVIPTTGIPLPFFSSGGSSILFTLAICGFLVNASRNEIGPNDDIEMEEIIYE